MLLRRFMDHVRMQNWLAVLLDFGIVVFGVFVGMQVNNWNAEREEAERQQSVLERLRSDYETLEFNDAYAAVYAEQGFRAAHVLIRQIELGQLDRLTEEQILSYLTAALSTRPPNGPSATYLEIVSSGQVSLLENTELRDTLADYDARQTRYQTAHEALDRLSLETVLPLWEGATYDDEIGPDGVPVLGEIATFDIEALKTDPALLRALHSARRIMGSHYSFTNNLATQSNAISVMLEEELGAEPSERVTAVRDQRSDYRQRAAEAQTELRRQGGIAATMAGVRAVRDAREEAAETEE